MDLLDLTAPEGPAWELLAAVLVVIAGPVLFERLRIPGLVGLLLGGFLIGPNALGILPSAGGIVNELGDIGLLYLMFLAGLELDLAVFSRYRREAIGFALLTFLVPQVLGTITGLLLGFDVPASILLGSIFASYTLVVYPVFRRFGLSTNRAVATAVGATVITDTLALVVLALVSGSATGDASGVELVVQIALGLTLLVAYSFAVVPRVARWFFRTIGQQRTLRYVFAFAALLSAAVLSEVVGIEPIVGAFFAGLALNRLVPNEGEFMERIEFFGSALLIPLFLVSVGTIIDVRVLADPGTIGLAVAFSAALLVGKVVAAVATRPLFAFTWDEVGGMFALSVAQAAATLAATFVGLEIGLFSTNVVNAVMLVIVVSLLVASTTANRFGPRIPRPPVDETKLGRSVLVQVTAGADGLPLFLAARLAGADAGVLHPVYVVPDGEPAPGPELVEEIEAQVARLGADAELDVRHDRSVIDGLLHAKASKHASLVVAPAVTEAWLPTLLGAAQHALVSACDVPTVLVRPGLSQPERVVVAFAATQARRPTSAARFATEVADRLHREGLHLAIAADAPVAAELTARLGRQPAVTTGLTEWLREHVRPNDLVVLPGGRNGALSTARTTKLVASLGASIAVVADATSVAPAERASQSLGLVTGRRSDAG